MCHDKNNHRRTAGTPLTRRSFLGGTLMGCSAAIAGMAGARLSFASFQDPAKMAGGEEVLVVVFLRGGADGLSIVPPIDGVDRAFYEAARPELQIPLTGPNAALPLTSNFGLHPAAAPLHELYQDGYLAVVQAVGMNVDTRSHFDAMEFLELGTPGSKSSTEGWLTRHLASASNLPADILMPSLAVGELQPTSLVGDRDTLAMDDPGNFNLNTGPWLWRYPQRTALRRLYASGASLFHDAGLQALNAADLIEAFVHDDYVPSHGASYPSNSFGDQLRIVAQMIKLDVGLRVVTVDLGGWDTHENQGTQGGGYFAGLVGTLAQGLHALFTDLDGAGAGNYTQRLTAVVQSEFGRRLRSNADDGLDHGHGNAMLVLSGNAIGGVHGTFPGLATEQLYDNADLAVTTDFRRVLSEILIRRMGNSNLGAVFPGYSSYAPLGIVQGVDVTPITGETLFTDSFESGNMDQWTVAQP